MRFPARYDFLAAIRFDLLLVVLIMIFLWLHQRKDAVVSVKGYGSSSALIILVVYVVISLPFVEWPGSVIKTNSLVFLKAALFYYFSVSLLTDERRTAVFVALFVGCQLFRVGEPLYLHFTEGYWGSFTNMGGQYLELMDRLSGSPYDVINPNGLAYVVVSVLPFLHYLLIRRSLWQKGVYLILLGVLLYTLNLTASRSGFVALLIVVAGIIIKSKHKTVVLSLALMTAVAGIASMTEIQKDRYLSTVRHDVRGGETSKDRLEGITRDFDIGMNNPVFGHGLGTSVEAITHVIGYEQISHNLYTEMFIELGFIGSLIFLFYIRTIFRNVAKTLTVARQVWDERSVEYGIVQALQVWLWMNLFFSLASYGLSNYQWYLFGGLAVVMRRLATQKAECPTRIG